MFEYSLFDRCTYIMSSGFRCIKMPRSASGRCQDHVHLKSYDHLCNYRGERDQFGCGDPAIMLEWGVFRCKAHGGDVAINDTGKE